MQIIYKKLHELTPYDKNPRVNDKAVEVVAHSILEYGFKNPIVVDKNGIIVNGHTRYLASIALELEEVPVIVADDLTDAQIKAFRIMDNKSSEFAEWDYELLFDEIKDIKLDLDADIESLTGFSDLELAELTKAFDNVTLDFEPPSEEVHAPNDFNSDNTYTGDTNSTNTDDEDTNVYTKTINIPQYTITGKKPELSELVNKTKAEELIANIKASSISAEEKEFLIAAASRHLAFNYQNVAEYYAHASAEMQELMEQSALVIIDYNDAMKYGYLKIKSEVHNMVEEWCNND